MNQARVLVVEDDNSLREALSDTLQLAGYSVASASNGAIALDILARNQMDLVVSDVQMKPMDGHTLLKNIKKNHPALPVILITAYGTIQKAVSAMHDGAADYLVKPFEADVLVNVVERYAASAPGNEETTGLIAEDTKTRQLVELAKRVAETEVTVMLSGESGTGKEVFARYLHSESKRAQGPFVAINCAAIPENMLEALLFGFEKGAFTGAYQATPGKFEQANGGTLLLDEISEMDLGLQAKLLRVLQEREVERLGGRKTIPLDVRVLATSNRVMREEVKAGRFREDLYYRLHVFPLHIPPLRERMADVLPLARFFLKRGAGPVGLTAAAEERLLTHSWPGNVRELDNVIQRAVIMRQGQAIGAEDIHFEDESAAPVPVLAPRAMDLAADVGELSDGMKRNEQRLIIDALRTAHGSRKSAAEKLGISQRTLRYKLARMRELGVEIPAGYSVKFG
ncbi:MAG: sigma-54 dependent transcriptional regulator [Pseudomonadota bacterium]